MSTVLVFVLGSMIGLVVGWLVSRRRTAAPTDSTAITERAFASEEALRRELADSLHRGVAQSLAAARMELSLLQRSLAPGVDAGRFDLLQQTTSTALVEVRDLMTNLYPQGVRIAQPDIALQLLAAFLARRHSATVELASAAPRSLPLTPLDTSRCAALCLCARNVIEIGLAASADKRVQLALSESPGHLSLQISHAAEAADDAYLLVRERLRLLGGTLHREIRSDGGTLLSLQLTRGPEESATLAR